MRIDKLLERNQNIRELKNRFAGIALGFTPDEWDNPVTKTSLSEAVWNIKLALDKELSK
jgi:hypothetical protein